MAPWELLLTHTVLLLLVTPPLYSGHPANRLHSLLRTHRSPRGYHWAVGHFLGKKSQSSVLQPDPVEHVLPLASVVWKATPGPPTLARLLHRVLGTVEASIQPDRPAPLSQPTHTQATYSLLWLIRELQERDV